jgi:ATP-dependent Clp protease adaptor protein ClpS
MKQQNQSNGNDNEEEGRTSTLIKNKIEYPKKYKVLLHNDDYTTMEFVIFILQRVFHKTIEEAEIIMMEVHNKGIGICGVYTFEIAETKASKVGILAQEHSHPLICTILPE